MEKAGKSGHRRRMVGMSAKMYFSVAQTMSFVAETVQHMSTRSTILDSVDVFVIPDHITLSSVADQLRRTGLVVGAQDTFWEDFGAYTGEISAAVLAEVGCRIVEIGHAERRRLFGETNADVARKAVAVARHGMLPLVCIGEHTHGEVSVAVKECSQQISAVMDALPDDAEAVLAYEPVWAIGAAKPADPEHIVSVARAIRDLECVRRRTGNTRILYGGSAGPGLFEKIQGGVDGLFLGRFAHNPKKFFDTICEVAFDQNSPV